MRKNSSNINGITLLMLIFVSNYGMAGNTGIAECNAGSHE